jgi:RNA methyltransferase, TrmH family
MTITSQQNRKLKEIRKLRQRKRWRERSGRFVAEGEDLLAAADAAGWPAIERYCAAGSGLPGVEVEAELLASASGLGSGTRTLAVYDERWAERPLGPLCLYLHGLHDPGNVGTILRSAQAFGASSVVLGPGTADPFNPKAVRASMGAVFSVPLVKDGDLGTLPGAKIALVPGAGVRLDELIPSDAAIRHQKGLLPSEGEDHTATGTPSVTLFIGAERDGLPQEVIDQAEQVAHIPIQTQSLNAAMAATVALYELRNRMARE